jgi:hypothetical protein
MTHTVVGQFDNRTLLPGMDWDMMGAFVKTESGNKYVYPWDWVLKDNQTGLFIVVNDEEYQREYVTNKNKINMNFGQALEALNEGKMIQREGWNGKGQFVYKTVGNTVGKDFIPKFASLPDSVKRFLSKVDKDVVFHSSLTLYNAQGQMQPGWVPSQGDLAAQDWQVFEIAD